MIKAHVTKSSNNDINLKVYLVFRLKPHNGLQFYQQSLQIAVN